MFTFRSARASKRVSPSPTLQKGQASTTVANKTKKKGAVLGTKTTPKNGARTTPASTGKVGAAAAKTPGSTRKKSPATLKPSTKVVTPTKGSAGRKTPKVQKGSSASVTPVYVSPRKRAESYKGAWVTVAVPRKDFNEHYSKRCVNLDLCIANQHWCQWNIYVTYGYDSVSVHTMLLILPRTFPGSSGSPRCRIMFRHEWDKGMPA